MVFNVLLDIFVIAKVPGIDCNIILKRRKGAFIFIHTQIYLYLYGMQSIYLDLMRRN